MTNNPMNPLVSYSYSCWVVLCRDRERERERVWWWFQMLWKWGKMSNSMCKKKGWVVGVRLRLHSGGSFFDPSVSSVCSFSYSVCRLWFLHSSGFFLGTPLLIVLMQEMWLSKVVSLNRLSFLSQQLSSWWFWVLWHMGNFEFFAFGLFDILTVTFFSITVIEWLEILSFWSCIWYQSSWGCYWVVIGNSGFEVIGLWLWFCSQNSILWCFEWTTAEFLLYLFNEELYLFM